MPEAKLFNLNREENTSHSPRFFAAVKSDNLLENKLEEIKLESDEMSCSL